ncbi:MAG: PolC-type DNA polymerase III [Clostridia bacterium]|nr:PolC-type DNA polymerase III [Clostridia bacterium]
MAELWKNLIAQEDPALAEALTLSRVNISKKTGEMRVRFRCEKILNDAQFECVQRLMSRAFPAVRVKTQMEYPALRQRVLEDISVASGLMKSLVRHESPGCMPFIDFSGEGWSLKDGVLTVCVSSAEGAAFLKARGVDGILAQKLGELFGIQATARIQITGDEEARIRQIAEARAREAELMAATAAQASAEPKKKSVSSEAVYGKVIHDPHIPMGEVTEDVGRCTLKGEVVSLDIRDAKNGETKIVLFSMTDYTGSVNCKLFLSARRSRENPVSVQAQADAINEALKPGKWAKVRGKYSYDSYAGQMVLMVDDIVPAEKPVREDTSPEKRVELHLHTNYSTMDACASATDLIKQAAAWGHRAIAVTDHGVVQAFPEAFGAAKKNKLKLIPGCEGYLIDDDASIVENAGDIPLKGISYVVLDVETTGLNTRTDEIIEIGAVRLENGVEVRQFSELIDPGRPVPDRVAELTGISSAMLRGKRTLMQVMPEFAEFCRGAVLVAHNASFDMSFFRRAFRQAGLPFDFAILDTLALVRNQYPQLKSHKLGNMCKQLGISLVNAHRAVHDARATSLMLVKVLNEVVAQKKLTQLGQLNTCYPTDATKQSYHIILLAASQTGMTNLYRLVSEGHLHYFYRKPRIPRSLISKYREGLIVGSACAAGELFQAILDDRDEAELKRIASFYDYLEIQPIGNNAFLKRDGTVADDEALRDLNRRIVRLGQALGKPVCATGDVHFLNPNDGAYRAILLTKEGYRDADEQPPLYFHTTDEMLSEFSYLGRDVARQVVIENPNAIADRIGDVKIFIPHPEGKETFQPFWPEAEGDLRKLVNDKAHDLYGDPLPEIVQKRIDKELGAIIGYGFSTLYMIAVKLVAKSLSDGYIVGSRGSVGSSLVAFLSGITEVNALPPHYACPKCRHTEFDPDPRYTTGLDLPPKICPECGTMMNKDGFNIPFEVFLGFKGDKVPDIDLNFSGEYQPRAHRYIQELFGEEYCFRAGTIGTIAEKTAYGYVLKYCEEKGITLPRAEMERLARGITGVKRTTGQHPAGMVVLPKEYEIYQFTPIQHPADDMTTETITTHFDFNSMHDVLVKLDVLGHDDPTMLRKLQDITGIAPQAVPLHDPEVFSKIISLFTGPEALGLTAEQLGVAESGTLGVPEFGTSFVRGMLKETRPSTMEELIRISGLSHGTDVWLGNAQDLVRQGIPLRECFCTRDDIMNALIACGVEASMAFKTMEAVRKGRGLTPEMEAAMREAGCPEWYIDTCKKIKYMFPKGHAVAYVTMALRIAYFKVFHPAAYYCCYLARNAESFDGTRMTTRDVDALRDMIEEIKALDKSERTATKDDEMTILEILIEMNLRGVHIKPIDIYSSRAADFFIDEDGEIVPPINSLPGIGLAAAEGFVEARRAGPFISQDDMVRRKVSKSMVEQLKLAGCLNDIPETSQVTLFEFGGLGG